MSSIYISGQITGTDDYMERFAGAEKYLTEQGYTEVINPAKINANLPENTPYKRYIDISLELLRDCDCIYMLDGWKNSKGARLEHAYAECAGMEILYEKDDGKTEEKKYFWRLNVKHMLSNIYLKLSKIDRSYFLVSPVYEHDDSAMFRFTEREYKIFSKDYGFPEDMFVKEEIE